MNNSEYVPLGTPSNSVATGEYTGSKEFNRAKWAIMAALVIELFFCGFWLFSSIDYQIEYGRQISLVNQILFFALCLFGCWQLTRMPQKSFRLGGWILGVAFLFDLASNYLAPAIDTYLLIGSDYAYLGRPILGVIRFLILLAGILAFSWNDGVNYGASSLIVALNLIFLGLSFVNNLPFSITGHFAYTLFFNALTHIGLIWAWWMFFKYSSPVPEYDSEELIFRKLIGNRMFIGVTVSVVLMIAALTFIANATLKF